MSLIEQIAAGEHDRNLDEIMAAVESRKTVLDPWVYVQELSEARTLIQMGYMQSKEKQAQYGVEAYRKIQEIVKASGEHPHVVGLAQLLLRRVLIECLGLDEQAADKMIADKTTAQAVNA